MDLGGWAGGEADVEEALLLAGFGDADAFGGAAVPGVGGDLVHAVVVAEGDVVVRREPGGVEGELVELGVVEGGDRGHRAVQDQDVEGVIARRGRKGFLGQRGVVGALRHGVDAHGPRLGRDDKGLAGALVRDVDAVEVLEEAERGARLAHAGVLVVARDGHDGDAGAAELEETVEGVRQGAVGGAHAVEQVARVDDQVGAFGDGQADEGMPNGVDVGFTLVQARRVGARVLGVAEVGVRCVEQPHSTRRPIHGDRGNHGRRNTGTARRFRGFRGFRGLGVGHGSPQ